MNITNIIVSPVDSILPTIELKLFFDINTNNNNLKKEIINVTGFLNNMQGKRIAYLNLIEFDKKNESSNGSIIFEAKLNTEILDFIQDTKEKEFKNDIKLTLYLNYSYYYKIENGVKLINYNRINSEITIPANDWVINFCPKLGLGKFIIVYLPDPNSETPDDYNNKELISRIYKRFQQIKEKYVICDWSGVMYHSRLLLDILRNNKEIDELLGLKILNKDGMESLKATNNNLYSYLSKFGHETEKDKVTLQPLPIPNKEEALFIYSYCLTFLNIIITRLKDQKDNFK